MSDAKPKGRGPTEVAVVVGLVALVMLGCYLFYRTIVGLGGFGGWLALMGRMLLQFVLVVATFVAYIGFLALLHLLICLFSGTKLRRARVFISFKHEYEHIASEIENGLVGGDIAVLKIPFSRARDHDDVIAESLEAVASADALVVVPGPEPSWMANELGLAVGTQKPIVVIKHLANQNLSDSLYRGYAVFAWSTVCADGFRPLRRFLSFATKGRGDVWPQFLRGMAGSMDLLAKGFLAYWLISSIVKEVSQVLLAFAPRLAESVATWWLWTIFTVVAAVFAVGFAGAFLRRQRGLAVARQKIRTRAATFTEFSSVFSLLAPDRAILLALERAPLEPRHEPPLGSAASATEGSA